MPKFVDTIHPTPFGYYDADTQFQQEADSVVKWVKRRLGDDVVSVELTNKMIFACLEEATGEATRHIHEGNIRNNLVNVLGLPTGSDMTNKYPRQTLDYLVRMTMPYGAASGIGGDQDAVLAYIDVEVGKQDYNIFSDIISAETNSQLYLSGTSDGDMLRILDIWHNDPVNAYGAYYGVGLAAAGAGDALALQDMFGGIGTSYMVMPVFEDILRRGMMETAARVRRSWYSYQLIGSTLRLYPTPTSYRIQQGHKRIWMRVYKGNTSKFLDSSITGIGSIHQVPFNNIPYSTFNHPLKMWIRQMCLSLCMETLGRVRSKMSSIPIPGGELRLDGPELLSQAEALKTRLKDEMKDLLGGLTTASLMEQQANQAEQLNRVLRLIPIRAPIKRG